MKTKILIGNRLAKNNVFVPAHATALYGNDGVMTTRAYDYYKARIIGGAGIVFLGETLVAAEGETWGIPVSRDENILDYRRLAEIANENECLLFDQLSNQGGQVWWRPGAVALAPSSLVQPISGMRGAEMNQSDIRRLHREFVASAIRIRNSGLHGCELKVDQGKIFNQFLSTRFNQREDDYGGSITHRRKFLLDVLRDIREAVPEIILGIRISIFSGYCDIQGFSDIETAEVIELVVSLADMRLIDFANFSSSTNAWPHGYWLGHADFGESSEGICRLVELAKKRLNIPVFFAGQFGSLSDALLTAEKGICDFVGLARAHIAEPELVHKYLAGESLAVPCIKCNQGCVGNTWEGLPISCTINPRTGNEGRFGVGTRARFPTKEIVVIGGGIAGVEFALRASERRHKLHLFERMEKIGGRLREVANRETAVRWVDFLKYQEKRLNAASNIELHMGEEWTPMNSHSCDLVVVASGREWTKPKIPSLPGAREIEIISVSYAYREIAHINGLNILIVEEDPYEGALGLAVHLADMNRVSVASTQEFIGKGQNQASLAFMTGRLRKKEVELMSFVEISHFERESVVLRDLCSGKMFHRSFDKIIFGNPPLKSPAILEGLARPTHFIGDALFPRGVEFALLDAWSLAESL